MRSVMEMEMIASYCRRNAACHKPSVIGSMCKTDRQAHVSLPCLFVGCDPGRRIVAGFCRVRRVTECRIAASMKIENRTHWTHLLAALESFSLNPLFDKLGLPLEVGSFLLFSGGRPLR